MTATEIGLVISIAGLAIVLIGGLVKVMSRLTAVETKVEVFWKNVSYDAAKILHSPDPAHKRMDELIEKFLDDQIERDELNEFAKRLRQKKDDTGLVKGERLAAAMLLRAVEQRYDL